jgi:hypothetical protein
MSLKNTVNMACETSDHPLLDVIGYFFHHSDSFKPKFKSVELLISIFLSDVSSRLMYFASQLNTRGLDVYF